MRQIGSCAVREEEEQIFAFLLLLSIYVIVEQLSAVMSSSPDLTI